MNETFLLSSFLFLRVIPNPFMALQLKKEKQDIKSTPNLQKALSNAFPLPRFPNTSLLVFLTVFSIT